MPQMRLEENKLQRLRHWLQEETAAIEELPRNSLVLGRRSLYVRLTWHMDEESFIDTGLVRKAHLELIEEAEASGAASNRQYLTGIRDAAAVLQGWLIGFDAATQ